MKLDHDPVGDSVLKRLHWSGSARHLALIRIVIGLHLWFWVFRSDYLRYLGKLSAGATSHYWSLIPASWVTATTAQSIHWFGGLACGLMVFGLFTRLATVATTFSFLVTNHYYYVNTGFHDDWLYFNVILLVLCCARCGDVWSVDSWLSSFWGSRNPRPTNTQVYRWPVEVMLAWFCLLYIEAGLAKLFPLEHGMAWFHGSTIQTVAITRLLDSPIYWWLGRPLFDYRIEWPFVLMAIVTVVVELSTVIPLLTRRWHAVCYVAVFGLHMGIYVVGVPGFPQIALACGCLFLPSEWFGDCTAAVNSEIDRGVEPATQLPLAA